MQPRIMQPIYRIRGYLNLSSSAVAVKSDG